MTVKRTKKHVVIGPDDEKTKRLVQNLEICERIVEGLVMKTMTKEKAMELINEEFPKNPHYDSDRDWTDKWMPWIIDRILAGMMSEDEACYNIHRCIT
jgi:hypothetical protein